MKEIEDTFSRFDRIPSCDRQTDRQTDILRQQSVDSVLCIARKTYSTERLDASIGQVYKPTSASCELDLWPPDHKSWSFHTLASWTYTSLCQFATKSVHLFSKYYVRKVGNGRTNGQVDNIMPPVNLDWRRHKKYQTIWEPDCFFFHAVIAVLMNGRKQWRSEDQNLKAKTKALGLTLKARAWTSSPRS